MKSLTFFYADDARPAHVVIGRDGLVFRYKALKGNVKVRLCKDGYGPTLRQYRMVEEFAQQARTAGAKIVFKKDTYPWETHLASEALRVACRTSVPSTG